jgi:sulfate adenylyltransferase
VLVHPVIGLAGPGGLGHFTRVRCLQAAVRHLDPGSTVLALLPLATRQAGPRELLLQALVEKNHGCSHVLVEDDAEPLRRHRDGTGVTPVPARQDAQVPDPDGFRPEVAELLAEAYPAQRRRGLTVWLTGLSAAGKSTLAELLAHRLLEYGRASTVLDGDIVRTHLSKGLGFSRADRDTNIRRMGFVAALITRHGGTVICAAISPYRALRAEIRARIGNYVEVFANAPLEVCEARDRKGCYRKARAGKIKDFTGVDDPYEPPLRDFIECLTDRETPEESVAKTIQRLHELGYI